MESAKHNISLRSSRVIIGTFFEKRFKELCLKLLISRICFSLKIHEEQGTHVFSLYFPFRRRTTETRNLHNLPHLNLKMTVVIEINFSTNSN